MAAPIAILSTIFWLVSVPIYVLVLRKILRNRKQKQFLKTSFFTVSVSLGIAHISQVSAEGQCQGRINSTELTVVIGRENPTNQDALWVPSPNVTNALFWVPD